MRILKEPEHALSYYRGKYNVVIIVTHYSVDNLIFTCLVVVASTLSSLVHNCNDYLEIPYLVTSLCSYILMGTNLSPEQSTIISRISPTETLAKA